MSKRTNISEMRPIVKAFIRTYPGAPLMEASPNLHTRWTCQSKRDAYTNPRITGLRFCPWGSERPFVPGSRRGCKPLLPSHPCAPRVPALYEYRNDPSGGGSLRSDATCDMDLPRGFGQS